MSDITQLLCEANEGSDKARAEIIQLAYDDLRRLATASMKNERLDHTLGTTGLVNEVSMRLLGGAHVPESNRGQFLGFIAKAMRNVLIDHARIVEGGDPHAIDDRDAVFR